MALIAVNAVVHRPIYIRVTEVVGIVAAMTGRAMEYRVVVRIRMTRGANAVGALGIANREPRTFTSEETAQLIDLGRAIAAYSPQ